jgi:protein MpaA
MVDAATGTKALAIRDVAANLTSLTITGLPKGTSVRFQVQAINVLGASAYSTRSNAVTVLGPPGYHTGTQTIGYSVQGRAIALTIVGSPTAKKRVMVIGEIHGNERGGVPIATALAKSRAPAGVAYFVVSYPNPDGAALNTRGNARRVDLNRNFPGWKRNGRPGYVYYPGTGALSEPESRAIYAAVKKIKPTAFVTYHQRMNVVDYSGGNRSTQATYARRTGMRFVQLSRYPGSQATWLHAAYPSSTVMTVELPARVTGAMASRHIAALKYLAAHH